MQAAAARFAWEQGCASSRGTRHHGSRGFALQHTSAARQPAAPPGAVAERVEAASSDGGALRLHAICCWAAQHSGRTLCLGGRQSALALPRAAVTARAARWSGQALTQL